MFTGRSNLISGSVRRQASAEFGQIIHGCVHACDIFVDECAGFDLAGRFIRDEIFAKRGEFSEQFSPSPKEAHVWRENFVTRANKIVCLPGLYVDWSMRSIVNAVQKNL